MQQSTLLYYDADVSYHPLPFCLLQHMQGVENRVSPLKNAAKGYPQKNELVSRPL